MEKTDKQLPLIDLHEGLYGILIREKVFQEQHESEIASMLENSMQFFNDKLGKNLVLRFEENDRSHFFEETLKRSGFVYQMTRIEYRTRIQDIVFQGNPPSCLAFKTLYQDHDIDMNTLFKVLGEIYNANEKDPERIIPETAIAARLEKQRLAEEGENVELAYLDGSLIGIIITSITKSMDAGTINFMGLSPDQRGKGLGKWLFERAIQRFSMLNVKEYIDGTDCSNIAMRKIFEAHNCKKFLTLQEWIHVGNRQRSR